MLPLWLWGTFEVRAVVIDIRGRTIDMQPYYLQFDTFFEPTKFRELDLTIRDEGTMSAS
jgi:hypothetical protein